MDGEEEDYDLVLEFGSPAERDAAVRSLYEQGRKGGGGITGATLLDVVGAGALSLGPRRGGGGGGGDEEEAEKDEERKKSDGDGGGGGGGTEEGKGNVRGMSTSTTSSGGGSGKGPVRVVRVGLKPTKV